MMISSNSIRDICICLCIDTLIIPGKSPHQTEYSMYPFTLRHILSGFHGSAGTLILSSNGKSALWTDGRYEEEVTSTLDTCDIIISEETDWKSQLSWIRSQHSVPCSVGISNMQITVYQQEQIQSIAESLGITVKMYSHADILTAITPHIDYTPPSKQMQTELWSIPPQYIDNTPYAHLDKIVNWLQKNKCSGYVSANIHEIAWCLGLRGTEIPYLMLFSCVLIVLSHKHFLLWLPSHLRTTHTNSLLNNIIHASKWNYTVKQYECFMQHPQQEIENSLSAHTSPYHIVADQKCIPACLSACTLTSITSPISMWKSIYSNTAIQSLTDSISLDCIHLLESITIIHQKLQNNIPIDEQTAASIVEHSKAASDKYIQLSFPVISAYGKHSAIPHYKSTTQSNTEITDKEPYLVDSGAHYLYGTTDITRVFYFGKTPPTALKEDYTAVLQALIALSTHIFTENTYTNELDAVPRTVLQNTNRTYNHGTGHGVGFCTDVHEGIQRLSQKNAYTITLMPNMVISNEPAYYTPGKWGIRLENLLAVQTENKQEGTLSFATLTFFPFQMKLINYHDLSIQEKTWIENYHRTCVDLLSNHISNQALKLLHELIEIQ